MIHGKGLLLHAFMIMILGIRVVYVQSQELLGTFFFLLIALFVKELVFRITRPLPSTKINYFDFVRRTIFSCLEGSKWREVLRVVIFSIAYGIPNIVWLAGVYTYSKSFDKVVVLEFPNFLVHFLLMLLIASSIFVTYWVFGLVSLWRYGEKEEPFGDDMYKIDERDALKKRWFYWRLLLWLIFLCITIFLAKIAGFHLPLF